VSSFAMKWSIIIKLKEETGVGAHNSTQKRVLVTKNSMSAIK
jgi:hypothetical protein